MEEFMPRPDLVAQAERIVNGIRPTHRAAMAYSALPKPVTQPKPPTPRPKKGRTSTDVWLDVSIIASCLVLAVLLISQL